MQAVALKKEAKRAIDALSEEKVKVAVDFINYLREREEMEATLEVLSSRELMAQIGRSEDELVPWETVKGEALVVAEAIGPRGGIYK